MSPRAPSRAWLGVAAATAWLASLTILPLLVVGGAFLYTDEMYGYLESHNVAATGRPEVPIPLYYEVGGAFVPMGSGGAGPSISGSFGPGFLDGFSPFASGGPQVAQLGIATFALLVIPAVFVIGRFLAGNAAGVVASLFVAVLPTTLFWSTFFMANMPTLTAFLVSLAMLALFIETQKRGWMVGAAAFLLFALVMRRDTLFLVIPFALILASYAVRRPWLWLGVGLAILAGATAFRISNGLADSLATAIPVTPTDWQLTLTAALSRFEFYHGPNPDAFGTFRANVVTYLVALAPVLVLAAPLGVALRYKNRRAALLAAGLLALSLIYTVVVYSILPNWGADPPGVMSSLVRYGLIVPVVLAILLAGGFTQLFAGNRRKKIIMIGITTCLLVPTAAASILDAPGLLWLQDQREWRVELNHAAAALPTGGILVGDEASKFVTSRPVVAPFNVYSPQSVFATPTLDRLADRHDSRAFITYDSFQGDWTGVLGNFLADTHHAALRDAEAPMMEIVWTNSTLEHVGILRAGDWAFTPEGDLVSASNYSEYRATPTLSDDLAFGRAAHVRVSLTYRDVDQDLHRMGYTNAPSDANNVHVARTWRGTGSDTLHTIGFDVPADTTVNGAFFISGNIRVVELRLTTVDDVVET